MSRFFKKINKNLSFVIIFIFINKGSAAFMLRKGNVLAGNLYEVPEERLEGLIFHDEGFVSGPYRLWFSRKKSILISYVKRSTKCPIQIIFLLKLYNVLL